MLIQRSCSSFMSCSRFLRSSSELRLRSTSLKCLFEYCVLVPLTAAFLGSHSSDFSHTVTRLPLFSYLSPSYLSSSLSLSLSPSLSIYLSISLPPCLPPPPSIRNSPLLRFVPPFVLLNFETPPSLFVPPPSLFYLIIPSAPPLSFRL